MRLQLFIDDVHAYHLLHRTGELDRDVKFGIQIGSYWPQMGQIWDFKISFSTLQKDVPLLVPNTTQRCHICA